MSGVTKMGLSYKRGSKMPRSLHELNNTNHNHHQNQPESDDDTETEEEPCNVDVDRPLPRRIRGKGYVATEDEVDTDYVPVTSAIRHIPHQKKPSKSTKVRMTTDICSELHNRLRIYGIREGKTNIQIVEGWIETFCPD